MRYSVLLSGGSDQGEGAEEFLLTEFSTCRDPPAKATLSGQGDAQKVHAANDVQAKAGISQMLEFEIEDDVQVSPWDSFRRTLLRPVGDVCWQLYGLASEIVAVLAHPLSRPSIKAAFPDPCKVPATTPAVQHTASLSSQTAVQPDTGRSIHDRKGSNPSRHGHMLAFSYSSISPDTAFQQPLEVISKRHS
ncbi:hypothetical protein GQ54DRAFT_128969 [Martensiomyces pterosporus]|nr:hypothetical protein GQ54DRAFT_128969 [Martensiomyces pterosporus]